MRPRRSSWIAIAILIVGLGLGGWWLAVRDGASGSRAGETTGRGATALAPRARGATDPATGVPRWLAHAGISRRIAGTVVDENGAPMRGAIVRIASVYTDSGLLKPASRTTDDAGRFDFGAQPATEYTVTAEHTAMTGTLVQIDLRHPSPTQAPDQLRLVLHPCIASIHGTIQDTSGGLIGGGTREARRWRHRHRDGHRRR